MSEPARDLGQRKPALRRRFAILVAGSALLWLSVMLIGGNSGVLSLWRARAKLEALEQQVGTLEKENLRLRQDVTHLEHDDRAVERIAREELMMARPDEEVILVPDAKVVAAAEAEARAARAAAKNGGRGAAAAPRR